MTFETSLRVFLFVMAILFNLGFTMLFQMIVMSNLIRYILNTWQP